MNWVLTFKSYKKDGEKVKMNKLAIYPFNLEFSPVLRHRKLLERFFIHRLLSPKGWGYCDKDAGICDGGGEIGITVGGDFDSAIDECDSVMFIDSNFRIDFEKNVFTKILKAVNSHKNIEIAAKLDIKARDRIVELCRHKGVDFTDYCQKEEDTFAINKDGIYPETLHKIHVPVVFIMGVSERTNKFEVQLSLREHLTDMGYKVSQVGTKPYCELLSSHSFPGFMTGSFIPETQKIVFFNRYVKSIEENEKPDVIIIGIPGGIMAFNDELTNRFGILAYEVSQAVTPDFAILSILNGNYEQDFFSSIFNNVKYRFGFEIDCYSLANVQIDPAGTLLNKALKFMTLDEGSVKTAKRRYQEMEVPVYDILDPKDSDKMVNHLVNSLSGYVNSQIV